MGISILVVEDEFDLREVFTEVLVAAGNSVRAACHGQHALELLEGGLRPQIILLDILMPVMNGLTFLERKKKIRELAQIPVVVVSSAESTLIDGACCVLRKPVDPGDLIAAVRTHTA